MSTVNSTYVHYTIPPRALLHQVGGILSRALLKRICVSLDCESQRCRCTVTAETLHEDMEGKYQSQQPGAGDEGNTHVH